MKWAGRPLMAYLLAELLSWAGLGLAYTLAAWAMCALGLATFCAVVRLLPQAAA